MRRKTDVKTLTVNSETRKKDNKKNVTVYVDAKIVGMHDSKPLRKAYVAYVLKNSDVKGFRPIDPTETDIAEIRAILFAIEELRNKFSRITIICDHESVVSEANKGVIKNKNSWLGQLQSSLRENPSIKLKPLPSNPAHKILTEYVNKLKMSST